MLWGFIPEPIPAAAAITQSKFDFKMLFMAQRIKNDSKINLLWDQDPLEAGRNVAHSVSNSAPK